jgi:hypothetical protein
MDTSKLKRDAARVRSTLVETPDHQLITKSGCTIYVPANYTDKGLAVITSEVSILGVYALFIDDVTYCVSNATCMLTISPDQINTVQMDDEEYFKFSFNPGSVVIQNTMSVKNKKLTNYIMDYFIDYGHTPWFMNYQDLAELFSQSRYYNNMRMGQGQPVLDIIVAGISRNPKNVREYYRHAITTEGEITGKPRFVPLRDIAINTTSNLARLNGSELQRGIKSALLSEPQRSEPLEELLIK